MKVAAGAADGFVRKPDPRLRAILMFGDDEGLVVERAITAAKSVCPDLADPFRVVELSAAQIEEDPARLADEFAAISMIGGRRVVRVRPADERVTPALEALLAARSGDALVVLEAGALRRDSALRQLAEGGEGIAAIACYQDNDSRLGELIDEVVRGAGLRVTPEARGWIIAHLGGDRAQSRSELEKLVLYKGPAKTAGDGAAIDVDDAMAILGDTAAIGLDDVVFATFDGDPAALDRALDRVFAEGIPPVVVVRALQRHAGVLHLNAFHIAAGAQPAAVLKRIFPPVHFSRQASWLRQFRLWPVPRASDALSQILEAEMECKTTGLPDRALARRLGLRLAQAARRAEVAAQRR